MGGKTGGGGRSARAGAGAGAGGASARAVVAPPRTVDASAVGLSISRKDEYRSSRNQGQVEESIFTFTDRNGASQKYRIQTKKRAASQFDTEVNVSKPQALQQAVDQFNRANNVSLTNLPKLKLEGRSRSERQPPPGGGIMFA